MLSTCLKCFGNLTAARPPNWLNSWNAEWRNSSVTVHLPRNCSGHLVSISRNHSPSLSQHLGRSCQRPYASWIAEGTNKPTPAARIATRPAEVALTFGHRLERRTAHRAAKNANPNPERGRSRQPRREARRKTIGIRWSLRFSRARPFRRPSAGAPKLTHYRSVGSVARAGSSVAKYLPLPVTEPERGT